MIQLKTLNMKNWILLSSVCLTLSLSFQSCSKDDDDYPMDNQSFVTQASSSNNFEVAAGAIAQTKGVRAEVKKYGEHMVMDHGSVGAEMINLAKTKGWSIPASLQAKEQANLDRLIASSSGNFDKEFAAIMVASHKDAIDLFTTASGKDGVRDADLRTFAAGKLPSLTAHLADATILQAAVGQ
jgi:putative membrane protein